jgi:hypothetical protein
MDRPGTIGLFSENSTPYRSNSELIMPFRRSATSGRIATLDANRADADREEAPGRPPEIRREPSRLDAIGEDLPEAPVRADFAPSQVSYLDIN